MPRILKLKPRDVKKVGISKQTLSNIKKKIKHNQIDRISNRIKFKFTKMNFYWQVTNSFS